MSERTLLDRLAPRSILIAGYLSACVVLLLGISVYYAAERLSAAYSDVFYSQGVVHYVRELEEGLFQAEAMQRRYTSTGDETALSNFERIALAQPVIIARLKNATEDHPGDKYSAIDTLSFYARLRLAELNQMIKRRTERNEPQSVSGSAEALMSGPELSPSLLRFRALSSAIYNNVERANTDAWNLGRVEIRKAVAIVLAGGVASVILVVVFTLLSRKQERHQSNVFSELEQQSLELARQAEEASEVNRELEIATREMVAQAAEAEASKLRLSGILGTATDAIVSFDDDRRIVYLNTAAERMLGLNINEALGLEITDFVVPDMREKVRGYITTARFSLPAPSDEVKRWSIMIERSKKDSVPVEMSIAYAQATEKQGLYTALLRDVSKQRQLEEQLRQSQKMEAVGRLAGGIAHDFNNLLTVIGASSDFILQRKDLEPGSVRDDIIEIRKATDRAAALTRQLLAFSRRQLVHPVVTDLNYVVEEMKSMLQRLIGEDIELRTYPASDPGYIKIDRGQLEQVIANLCVNARDAMPQGGVLELRTEIVETPSDVPLAVEGGSSSGYMVLIARDNGIGMERDIQARVFEPFFTTKAQGKGTGLGLPTVYGIVRQAGGDIVIDSTPGGGTEFRLYFPMVTEEVEETVLEDPIVSSNFRGDETVLIVEDEVALRQLAQRILQSRGYTVMEAANGHEAINVMASHGQRINLVLTDIVMPQMGGRELVERLLPLYPTVKVLFMTGYTEDTLLKHRIAELGIAVLEKPFTPDALAKAVRQALDRGRSKAHGPSQVPSSAKLPA